MKINQLNIYECLYSCNIYIGATHSILGDWMLQHHHTVARKTHFVGTLGYHFCSTVLGKGGEGRINDENGGRDGQNLRKLTKYLSTIHFSSPVTFDQ